MARLHPFLTVFDEKRHKDLKYLSVEYEGAGSHPFMPDLCALVLKYDLKMENIRPEIFLGMKESQRNQFATKVSSLGGSITKPGFQEFLDIEVLPEVKTVAMFMGEQTPEEANAEHMKVLITRNLSLLSPDKLPGLRTLILGISDWNGGKLQILTGLWSCCPSVEELRFTNNPILLDFAFLGENGELPFLQLIS